MNLRAWQSECIALAIDHYYTNKHFLCLATPGAGKTTMAAELASQLFKRGDIDLVLCFAPSLTVVSSLQRTFSQHLTHRFDGQIGSIGGAYTYQSMRCLGEQFWSLFESHRVLVIFDEIHHCSGSEHHGANTWGQEIIRRIKHQATHTLALTGTPWRSDNNPIVLAEYTDSDGLIHCDYSYGLQNAVRDKVCRKPGIVLIDNDNFKLSAAKDEFIYKGLDELLRHSNVRYQHLLYNDIALRYCLSLGCRRLEKLRMKTINAGGLVVASSVAHAQKIAHMLHNEFRKSVSVVSYMHKNSEAVIDRFRSGGEEWIVSVGMISEGTDIPRLQVCCHLSRITTELYFRQVLGRILRATPHSINKAWLYTFAEPKLVEYAERLAKEIPYSNVLEIERAKGNFFSGQEKDSSDYVPSLIDRSNQQQDYHLEVSGFDINSLPEDKSFEMTSSYSLECLGDFRRKMVNFFHTDLK